MNKEHKNSNIEIQSHLCNSSSIKIPFYTKITIIPFNTKITIIPFNYKKDDLVDINLNHTNNEIKYHNIYSKWFFNRIKKKMIFNLNNFYK